MDIVLLMVGKTTQSFVKEGMEEYVKRLRRYTAYRVECIPDIKGGKSLTEAVQKEKEGDGILSFVSASDLCVLLDEHGRQPTSVEFADTLQKYMASGRKRAVFVIGGPYGFSQKVYARADAMMSLSKMTFTHEMVRLFFTEQVYRAMTILRGEPYHHE